MFFTRHDRALLHAVYAELRAMAINLANLQAAVSQLATDVNALIALVPNPGADAAVQAQVDAVTASLSALDAAVKTAEAPPAGATGATGAATA